MGIGTFPLDVSHRHFPGTIPSWKSPEIFLPGLSPWTLPKHVLLGIFQDSLTPKTFPSQFLLPVCIPASQ